MEIVKFMKFLSGKSFHLEPTCEWYGNFTAQHQVNNFVEEQFRKFELTELGLSVVHLSI